MQWEEVFCCFLVVVGPGRCGCIDVCRNVDSFPFRQIFALPICPNFRKGHAEFFPLAFMHVCVHMVWFSPIFSILTAQATMVLTMSEGRIARYKKGAKEDMILNNKTMIRCPCRTCKLQRWIDPESGQLEGHLLKRDFMCDLNEAPTGHGGGHEDMGG